MGQIGCKKKAGTGKFTDEASYHVIDINTDLR